MTSEHDSLLIRNLLTTKADFQRYCLSDLNDSFEDILTISLNNGGSNISPTSSPSFIRPELMQRLQETQSRSFVPKAVKEKYPLLFALQAYEELVGDHWRRARKLADEIRRREERERDKEAWERNAGARKERVLAAIEARKREQFERKNFGADIPTSRTRRKIDEQAQRVLKEREEKMKESKERVAPILTTVISPEIRISEEGDFPAFYLYKGSLMMFLRSVYSLTCSKLLSEGIEALSNYHSSVSHKEQKLIYTLQTLPHSSLDLSMLSSHFMRMQSYLRVSTRRNFQFVNEAAFWYSHFLHPNAVEEERELEQGVSKDETTSVEMTMKDFALCILRPALILLLTHHRSFLSLPKAEEEKMVEEIETLERRKKSFSSFRGPGSIGMTEGIGGTNSGATSPRGLKATLSGKKRGSEFASFAPAARRVSFGPSMGGTLGTAADARLPARRPTYSPNNNDRKATLREQEKKPNNVKTKHKRDKQKKKKKNAKKSTAGTTEGKNHLKLEGIEQVDSDVESTRSDSDGNNTDDDEDNEETSSQSSSSRNSSSVSSVEGGWVETKTHDARGFPFVSTQVPSSGDASAQTKKKEMSPFEQWNTFCLPRIDEIAFEEASQYVSLNPLLQTPYKKYTAAELDTIPLSPKRLENWLLDFGLCWSQYVEPAVDATRIADAAANALCSLRHALRDFAEGIMEMKLAYARCRSQTCRRSVYNPRPSILPTWEPKILDKNLFESMEKFCNTRDLRPLTFAYSREALDQFLNFHNILLSQKGKKILEHIIRGGWIEDDGVSLSKKINPSNAICHLNAFIRSLDETVLMDHARCIDVIDGWLDEHSGAKQTTEKNEKTETTAESKRKIEEKSTVQKERERSDAIASRITEVTGNQSPFSSEKEKERQKVEDEIKKASKNIQSVMHQQRLTGEIVVHICGFRFRSYHLKALSREIVAAPILNGAVVMTLCEEAIKLRPSHYDSDVSKKSRDELHKLQLQRKQQEMERNISKCKYQLQPLGAVYVPPESLASKSAGFHCFGSNTIHEDGHAAGTLRRGGGRSSSAPLTSSSSRTQGSRTIYGNTSNGHRPGGGETVQKIMYGAKKEEEEGEEISWAELFDMCSGSMVEEMERQQTCTSFPKKSPQGKSSRKEERKGDQKATETGILLPTNKFSASHTQQRAVKVATISPRVTLEEVMLTRKEKVEKEKLQRAAEMYPFTKPDEIFEPHVIDPVFLSMKSLQLIDTSLTLKNIQKYRAKEDEVRWKEHEATVSELYRGGGRGSPTFAPKPRPPPEKVVPDFSKQQQPFDSPFLFSNLSEKRGDSFDFDSPRMQVQEDVSGYSVPLYPRPPIPSSSGIAMDRKDEKRRAERKVKHQEEMAFRGISELRYSTVTPTATEREQVDYLFFLYKPKEEMKLTKAPTPQHVFPFSQHPTHMQTEAQRGEGT